MNDFQTGLVIFLVLLVGLDLLISATRAALLNVSLARILSRREEQEGPVRRTVEVMHSAEHLSAALDLTQLLARFLLAGDILALFYPQPWNLVTVPLWAGVLALAALLLFIIEQFLEGLAQRNPELWALRLTPFARVLMFVLSPFLALPLSLVTGQVALEDPTGAVTEDELRSLVDASQEDGVLEQDEREMIYSIFDLGDTLVREVMAPRIYLTALDVNTSLEAAMDALINSGYSRVPVYEETVDNILGVIYAKDLLRAWRNGRPVDSLRSLLRQPYFVPEAKKLDKLLDEMQALQVHMAIVVDEYGGVAGLITMEDIVEEIVGEIRDEFDQAEELPYQQMGEGEFLFLGRIDLGTFNEVMGTQLARDEAETLGGLIYNHIGRVPDNGEAIQIGDLSLVVEQVSGRRIRKVRARRTGPPETTAEEQEKKHGE